MKDVIDEYGQAIVEYIGAAFTITLIFYIVNHLGEILSAVIQTVLGQSR